MRRTVPEAVSANLCSIALFGLCVEIFPASYKDSISFSSLVSFIGSFFEAAKANYPSGGHDLESVDQPLEILTVGGQQDGGPGMERTDCVEIIVDLSSPDSFFMS